MKYLIPVLVVAVVAIAVVLIVWLLNRSAGGRQARRERDRHVAFLDRLHKDALEARDVEPFAARIADDIRAHLTNQSPWETR